MNLVKKNSFLDNSTNKIFSGENKLPIVNVKFKII
jgi:hypothetical protein